MVDFVVDVVVDIVVNVVVYVVVVTVVDAVVVSFVVSKYFQRFKSGKTVTTLSANFSPVVVAVEVVVRGEDSVLISGSDFWLITTSSGVVALSSDDLTVVTREEEEALVGQTSSRGIRGGALLNLVLLLSIKSELASFTDGLFF